MASMEDASKQRMKILVVTTSLGTGGAEMALFRVLNVLRHHGVQPLVISIMAVQGKHFPLSGVEIRTLDMPRARLTWSAIRKARNIVREFQPDLIQGWMYHSNVLAHLLRAFAPTGRRLPLAIAIRGSLTIFDQEKRLTRWIIRLDAWLSRWCERVLYVSRLAHRQHSEFGYAAQRARVIPNGFDCQVFAPDADARARLRDELGLPASALLVGLIASWQPLKNHRGFLAAIAMLAERHPDVHVVCAGRGVTVSNLDAEGIIPESIRTRVHLLEERGDIASINAALDIAANVSYAEAFPNVVGEAMACGVPLVVTDVGDSAWILGGCGEVVPPGDDAALAAALERLLNMAPDQRQALGRQARARVIEHFSLESVALGYLQEWRAMLAEAKQG